MSNIATKTVLISEDAILTIQNNNLPESLSSTLSFNWINIVSLDGSGDPVVPSAGEYLVYVKTSDNTGFEKTDRPIIAEQTGGTLMDDGVEKGSFYGATLQEIKVVPNGVVGAASYQVHVRQAKTGKQPEVPVRTHDDSVAHGDIEGSIGFFAFGKNPSMAKDVEAFITDFTTTYNFLSAAEPLYISSSSAADTSVVMVVSLLDENYNRVNLPVVVDGQTKTLIAGGNYIRVFAVFNAGSVAHAGDIYVYPDTPVTAGVPDDVTVALAKSDIAKQQSNMAILTIPKNKHGLLKSIIVTANKANTTGSADLFLITRAFNGVPRKRGELNLQTAGGSVFTFDFKIPILLPEKTDIYLTGTPSVADYNIAAGFQVLIEDE